MKHICLIQLKNFQSHIDTALNFSSGLNVIVGPSDSGKTSVIRAIKWVLYDEPQGDSVLRTGADEVYVRIEMSDGSWIEKIRKKKKTVYTVYDVLTSQKEVFQGSRGDVKQRVGSILGMRFDGDGGKSSYNLQEQLAAPFLLSDSGSAKAAAIGQLIGLDIIDDATQGTRSDITSKKQQINRILKEENKLDEILNRYEGLEEVGTRLNQVEDLLGCIGQKQADLEHTMVLSEKIDHFLSQISDVQNHLKKYRNIETLEKIFEKINCFSETYHKQIQLWQKKEILENAITKNLQVLSDTAEIETLENKIQQLVKNLDRYSKILNFNLFMKKINHEITLEENVMTKTKNMDECRTLSEIIQNKRDQLDRLKVYLHAIYKIRTTLSTEFKNNEKFSSIDFSLELREELEDRVIRYTLMKKISEERKDIQLRLKKGNLYLSERNRDIQKKTLEYRQLWSEEKRCPTCHRPISEHEMEQIICEVEE